MHGKFKMNWVIFPSKKFPKNLLSTAKVSCDHSHHHRHHHYLSLSSLSGTWECEVNGGGVVWGVVSRQTNWKANNRTRTGLLRLNEGKIYAHSKVIESKTRFNHRFVNFSRSMERHKKRRVHISRVQIREWTVDVAFWQNISGEVNIGYANETKMMFPISEWNCIIISTRLRTYIHMYGQVILKFPTDVRGKRAVSCAMVDSFANAFRILCRVWWWNNGGLTSPRHRLLVHT